MEDADPTNGNLSGEMWEAIRDRMEQAIGLLPDLSRRVYLLSARDGRSHDDIAEHLGIDVAEVTRQLAAALVEIDKAMHPR